MNHLSLSDRLIFKFIKFSSTKFCLVVPLFPNSSAIFMFENILPIGIPRPNVMPISSMDSLFIIKPVFSIKKTRSVNNSF